MTEPKYLNKKDNPIIIKVDLKKTEYLKTEIIEKECITRFNMLIFDGPKYLKPRMDSISLYFLRCFFTAPE